MVTIEQARAAAKKLGAELQANAEKISAVLAQIQVGDRVTYMGGKTVWEVLRITDLDGGWARVAPADEADAREPRWFAIEHLTVVAP